MWLDCRVHPFKILNNYKCYLDGEFLEHCFAANEEEGWADICVLDENGSLIWEETNVKTKRLNGKVELRLVK